MQRMVRSLAAERTALSDAHAEIERLRLTFQKLQPELRASCQSAAVSDGAQRQGLKCATILLRLRASIS